MRMLLAGTLTLVALSANQPAQAYEAPWCAVHNLGDGVYWDCQYRTFEQCLPHVITGNRGFCNPNPAYSDGARKAPHRRR